MSNPIIILASSSIYRLKLLQQINIKPQVLIPSDVDESPLPHENPKDLSIRLAYLKAKKVFDKVNQEASANINTNKIIIACDQVLYLDNAILGKPYTHEKAIQQLKKMRNKTMVFYTALTMLMLSNKEKQKFNACVKTIVTMRNYSDELIEQYLHFEKPYNCAGSAKSEGLGAILIKSMISNDPSALIGLPLSKVIDGLELFDYNFLEVINTPSI